MLDNLSFFRLLPPHARSTLAETVQYRSYPASACIARQGDTARSVFFHLHGRVRVMRAGTSAAFSASDGGDSDGEGESVVSSTGPAGLLSEGEEGEESKMSSGEMLLQQQRGQIRRSFSETSSASSVDPRRSSLMPPSAASSAGGAAAIRRGSGARRASRRPSAFVPTAAHSAMEKLEATTSPSTDMPSPSPSLAAKMAEEEAAAAEARLQEMYGLPVYGLATGSWFGDLATTLSLRYSASLYSDSASGALVLTAEAFREAAAVLPERWQALSAASLHVISSLSSGDRTPFMPVLLQLLAGLELTQQLPVVVRKALCGVMTVEEWPRQALVTWQGEDVVRFAVLMRGLLSLQQMPQAPAFPRPATPSVPVPLSRYGEHMYKLYPGDSTGGAQLMEGGRHEATAVAVTRCLLITLTAADFKQHVFMLAPSLFWNPVTCKHLIRLPPPVRTPLQVSSMASYLHWSLLFFRQFPLDYTRKLCRVAEHVQLPAGEAAIVQGDEARRFYVVLSGQMGVYYNDGSAKAADGADDETDDAKKVKSSDDAKDEPRRMRMDSRPLRGGRRRRAAMLRRSSSLQVVDFAARNTSTYGKEVAILRSGDSFGHVALQHRSEEEAMATIAAGKGSKKKAGVPASPSSSGAAAASKTDTPPSSPRRAAATASPRRTASVVAKMPSEVLAVDQRAFESNIKRQRTKLVMTPAMAVNALSKPPSERNEDDINRLAQMAGTVGFLQQLPESKLRALCRVLKYRTCEQGEMVFQQGDVGDVFYVILTGLVHVRKQSDKEALASAIDFFDDMVKSALAEGVVVTRSILGLPPDKVDATLGPTLCTLEDGDSFGEAAVMSQTVSYRNASIVCLRNTELMLMTKEDYHTILCDGVVDIEYRPQLLEQRLKSFIVRERWQAAIMRVSPVLAKRAAWRTSHLRNRVDLMMALLKNVKLFNDIPRDLRQKICAVARYVTVSRGTLLYRRGDKPDKFYIVVSGTASLLRDSAGSSGADGLSSADGEHLLRVLNKEDCFGSFELMEDVSRQAAAKAESDLKLVTLSREAYRSLWPAAKRDRQRLAFIKSMQFVPPRDCERLFALYLLLKPEAHSRHSVVAREGTAATSALIVQEGQLKVCKSVMPSRSHSGAAALSVQVDISLLGPQSVLGEEERFPETAVVLSATATLLRLQKKEARHLLPRKLLRSIEEAMRTRSEWRHKRRAELEARVSGESLPMPASRGHAAGISFTQFMSKVARRKAEMASQSVKRTKATISWRSRTLPRSPRSPAVAAARGGAGRKQASKRSPTARAAGGGAASSGGGRDGGKLPSPAATSPPHMSDSPVRCLSRAGVASSKIRKHRRTARDGATPPVLAFSPPPAAAEAAAVARPASAAAGSPRRSSPLPRSPRRAVSPRFYEKRGAVPTAASPAGSAWLQGSFTREHYLAFEKLSSGDERKREEASASEPVRPASAAAGRRRVRAAPASRPPPKLLMSPRQKRMLNKFRRRQMGSVGRPYGVY
eukprot:PLAT4018.1.p1 GENE.PLAT4018.1~~PLAT4018.1.p1  ORF type:complete len:1741 (+),score=733.12 PLAT4018.1:741-5225(+)